MRIDSHQHFWRYSRNEYPWIKQDWPIRRNFLPADLAVELDTCGIDGCIAVQARQTTEESRWLLELANSSDIIKGVVGWVDLRSPGVMADLSLFASHRKFVGVRHVLQDEPEEFFYDSAFRDGISHLAAHGLTYDILIYPHQLPAAIDLARAFPSQPFVLDHLAKPCIRDKALNGWKEGMEELSHCPNVMCKLSGLVTEARWFQWQPGDFRPFFEVALAAFGPDRLMFGSDWPVALLAADYAALFELALGMLDDLETHDREKILGGNAARFYQL